MIPDQLSGIPSPTMSWIMCRAGRASMVNIGGKEVTERYALAAGKVYLGPAAYELVKENKMKKGDVLTVAQLAGAPAAHASCFKTSQLWPAANAAQLLQSRASLSSTGNAMSGPADLSQ